ncbi:hypothetical protein WME75_33295 [Sorangium sp. So ce1014]|uniref:hypothetical protein n=1 Tax=Sorangium sp. So ce1014 TaxID=3133326 RepID=UPI003F601857
MGQVAAALPSTIVEFGRAVPVAGLHLRLEGGQFGRDGVEGGAGLLVLGGRLALALLRRADRLEDGQGRGRGGAGGEGAPLGLEGGMVAPLGCFELCLEPRAPPRARPGRGRAGRPPGADTRGRTGAGCATHRA